MSSGRGPDFEVYTIVEREGQKDYWQRIGAGWENRDGSFNLALNALPLSGRLNVRPADDRPTGDGGEDGR